MKHITTRRRRVVAALTAVGGLVAAVVAAAPADAGLPTVTGTRISTATPSSSVYTALDGGVTDGTYWYSATVEHHKSGSKTYDSAQLIKTPLGSSTPTKRVSYRIRSGNATNLLGHANDIAYNADTGKLLIPTWTNDSSVQGSTQPRSLRVVNRSTLAVESTKTLPHTTTNICYDPTTHQYVAGTFNRYYVYDSAFHEKSTSGTLKMPGTGQGIDCDSRYVYVIASPKPGSLSTNRIYVYTWSFSLVRTYEYRTSSESEHLTHSGSTFYLGFNIGAGALYRLDGFQFTVRYYGGGGSGSMSSTTVLYGRSTALRKNTFTRSGYTFTGWTAQRSVDSKYRYVNPKSTSQTGWYTKGKQPSGWALIQYHDASSVYQTTSRGTVWLTAAWKKK